MVDFIEVDFLGVETARSGDAIAIRYSVNGEISVHVVDGGYIDTGTQVVEHVKKYYNTTHIDHVVLTHSDNDHANGLRTVLEQCTVGMLWMNRPWLYADELIDRFSTYSSVGALRSKLRNVYSAPAALEDIANEKGIPIAAAFCGADIGAFKVLAPSKSRYLDLIVESNKTPDAVAEGFLEQTLEGIYKAAKTVVAVAKAAWGHEYFPAEGTSCENEMSVVQYALVNNRRLVLTGDVGRDGLTEAADYAPTTGLTLPGAWVFQVPHHGGRHNVNTEVLDRWLGKRMSNLPEKTTWSAVCSSAKEDVHHPKKSVVRAMLHRGAHFSATEGRPYIHAASGITRDGMSSIPQMSYPEEQEE